MCYFIFVFFCEARSQYVALVILELTMGTRLASKSELHLTLPLSAGTRSSLLVNGYSSQCCHLFVFVCVLVAVSCILESAPCLFMMEGCDSFTPWLTPVIVSHFLYGHSHGSDVSSSAAAGHLFRDWCILLGEMPVQVLLIFASSSYD